MNTLIRLPAYFVLFVLLLSITVEGKPLFNYIYETISPATQYAQAKTLSLFGSSLTTSKVYAKKLFENSVPSVKKSVDERIASNKKKGDDLEEITPEEKKGLDNLIKAH
ncbi:MAG TPA: hypothetical protein VNJ01_12455 [Bacteriovoracaceae bacterium]|nr:hypothetical protein [Bacteriovoracaceae bacterium]